MCKAVCADCDAVVQSARGAAGRDALLAGRGHVERCLHLRRARAQGAPLPQRAAHHNFFIFILFKEHATSSISGVV
jgi:hypothetical protein